MTVNVDVRLWLKYSVSKKTEPLRLIWHNFINSQHLVTIIGNSKSAQKFAVASHYCCYGDHAAGSKSIWKLFTVSIKNWIRSLSAKIIGKRCELVLVLLYTNMLLLTLLISRHSRRGTVFGDLCNHHLAMFVNFLQLTNIARKRLSSWMFQNRQQIVLESCY